MIQAFWTFLLYVRLLTGAVVEDTGDWRFHCQAYNDDMSQVYTVDSGTWLDGVHAAYITIPSDMDFVLLCTASYAGVPEYLAPASIEDHDHDTAHAQALYLDLVRTEATMILQQPRSMPRWYWLHADVGCWLPTIGLPPEDTEAWQSPLQLEIHANYEYFPEIPGGERTYWANVPVGCEVFDVISHSVETTVSLPIVIRR